MNPIRASLNQFPTLQRRRDRGKACKTRVVVVYHHYSGEDRKSILVQVNSSEEKQHEWGVKVQTQEAVFNGDFVREDRQY